jgi:primosomal protein N' (replication factor Y)
VGILDADSMLNYPDFRSYERAFQLMSQVAGRSGRKGKQGLVIVQTRDVKQPIIGQIMQNDYKGMIDIQLSERLQFNYPPYSHLIYVYIKHRDERQVQLLASVVAEKMRKVFDKRVFGPDLPPVGRIQSLFIRRIVLKVEQNSSLSEARKILKHILQSTMDDKNLKSFVAYCDVDPM